MTDEALEGTDKFADAIVPHPKFSRSRDPKKSRGGAPRGEASRILRGMLRDASHVSHPGVALCGHWGPSRSSASFGALLPPMNLWGSPF